MSVEPAAGRRPPRPRHRIDDVLWQALWERQLDPVERHHIAVSVWRRRAPDDPFASLVGFELACRWRTRTTSLSLLWAVWTAFWFAMARVGANGPEGPAADVPVAVGLAVTGFVVVACCQLVRHRLGAVVNGSAGFRPARPPDAAPGA